MAKKKKRSTRRKAEPEISERSHFWPLAGALLMMISAFFLLLGGFGTGGFLPVSMFQGVYWALGWGAYLSAPALLFFGIWKFTSEDRRIPLSKFTSMLGFLVLSASVLHVSFTPRDLIAQEFTNGQGGAIGSLFGGLMLGILDKIPAAILFFVLAMLAFFLAFSISPQVLLKLLSVFKKRERKDTELAELKSKAEQNGFKLNEGVPVERGENKNMQQKLKNTAQMLAPAANHEALTLANDPDWQFPDINLLNHKQDKANAGNIEANADTIKGTLEQFGIHADMEGANIGPRVTQYTLKPPSSVKMTKITALEDNLTYDLASPSIRIEAPIPGKRLVGIEVPNVKPAMVRLSSVMQGSEWRAVKGSLGFVVGKDITGVPIVADLFEMPHLLIAGQTKAGKSVMINTLLTSLLYRNAPSDLKLILVDPKLVELAPYNDIPHLLTPVITEPEKCISALKWAVAEMERRYRAIAEVKRRNIDEYNQLKKEEGMPHILIVIDELAELMMMAARDVEALIVRIAQKARAVGIHLVLATQRPSVNVITGLIKANIPARIAFTVPSQVDSRTIIDKPGAEKLLGMGDMLFYTPDMSQPKRVQGAFISTEETAKVTDFLREQRAPQYDEEIISQPVQLNGKGGIIADYGGQDADDDMWRDAVKVVIEGRKASTSLLQRRLRIGYGRAARLIETMEEQGIVSSADGNRPREVLVSSADDVFGNASGGGQALDEVYDENFPDEKA